MIRYLKQEKDPMSEDIYRKLAQHLDKMPGGYPATEDGLELRILRRLFSPEQAELALHLNLLAETAEVIAHRAGLRVDEVRPMLAEMAEKGLIYDYYDSSGQPLYMGYQFVIGIWEFQVNKLDLELVHEVDEYLERFFDPQVWKETPQLRTIPVGESIQNLTEILPHEQAELLVEAHHKFAVAPCICRTEKQITGEACDKPLETCLILGGGADYYTRHGLGRSISKLEAFEILKIADQAGLVLQPGNSKKAGVICSCCGDCCGVLRNLKRYPEPGRLVSSPYRAVVDFEICSACETCVDRCQMEAIQVNGHAQVQLERCIGCGLCVTTCDTGAMRLERKPEDEQPYVPKNLRENLFLLGRKRSVVKTPELVKLAVRSKIDRIATNISPKNRDQ